MSARRIVSMPIEVEADIVAVRQCARLLAEHLQFLRQDQTRIATAVSEISRNAFSYARQARAHFLIDDFDGRQRLVVRIVDRGDGIADIRSILEGRYRSPEGMGLGIVGARKLLDHFEIQSGPHGTRVELGQYLPSEAPHVMPEAIAELGRLLGKSRRDDPFALVREQNRELLESLEDSRRRQQEAERLARELEDTNRGVVALYAELDAHAEQLRLASDIKSRFLSHLSHEFRTPLNSVMALSSLLLDGVDGDLSSEQRRQIGYIRKSANDLLDLVNDLLDLSKIEAGKLEVKPQRFAIAELFSTLRGALKPLQPNGSVELTFESGAIPEMYTDEGKVAQILRNLISNALKFTEVGEVHVSAHHDSSAGKITFVVSDTGIGIALEDQAFIFEEFSQVEGRLQSGTKGTGLGLPLSRRLAELLGGELWVQSEPGKGSTFFLSLPIELPRLPVAIEDVDRKLILIVDDDETFRYVLRQAIGEHMGFTYAETADGASALRIVRERMPSLVILDLQMPGMSGFELLNALRADPRARALPVLVCTSLHPSDQSLTALPEAVPIVFKGTISRERIRSLLTRLLGT